MENNFRSLISVIVPVYNSEPFLDKCISSVLVQSYSYFELILVNDGSTDHSLSILNLYAEKDPRILVLDKKNSGVSDTRNLGLRHANGENICFLDSDDWIEPDYFQKFVDHYENPETLVIQDLLRSRKRKNNYLNKTFDLRIEIDELLLRNRILSNGGPVGKFYENSLIKKNKIEFQSHITYGEDLLFYMEYLHFVKKLKYIDYAGYHYEYNNASASTKRHSFETYQTLNKRTQEFIKYINPSSEKALYYVYQINWDYIEQAIEAGVLSKERNKRNRVSSIKEISQTLNSQHFKYAATFNRKVIYILLKLKSDFMLKLYKNFSSQMVKFKTKT